MKRMDEEAKIAVTFVLFAFIGIIINGCYSVISLEESFLSFEVIGNGLITALAYLMYIWIHTRRHKVLAIMGVCGIALIILCFLEKSTTPIALNWKDTLFTIIYLATYVVAYVVASYQAKKLLEEERMEVSINLTLMKDVNFEDVEVNNDR